MLELAASVASMNSQHDIKPFDKINGFLITPWAGPLTIIMTIEGKLYWDLCLHHRTQSLHMFSNVSRVGKFTVSHFFSKIIFW